MIEVKLTDDVVERAAYALEKKCRQDQYGWSDDEFDIWWHRDERFMERITKWGWFGPGTHRDKCIYEARILLEAAFVVLAEASDGT